MRTAIQIMNIVLVIGVGFWSVEHDSSKYHYVGWIIVGTALGVNIGLMIARNL